MNIQVRYFAGAREAVGRGEETLALADGSSVAALLKTLVELHPGLEALGPSLRFALDESFVSPETPLVDGAVVALIPPVGGG